jgi:hypothetical protein
LVKRRGLAAGTDSPVRLREPGKLGLPRAARRVRGQAAPHRRAEVVSMPSLADVAASGRERPLADPPETMISAASTLAPARIPNGLLESETEHRILGQRDIP